MYIHIYILFVHIPSYSTSVSSFHFPFGLAFANTWDGTQAEAPVESTAFVVVAWVFGIPGVSDMFASHAEIVVAKDVWHKFMRQTNVQQPWLVERPLCFKRCTVQTSEPKFTHDCGSKFMTHEDRMV